jgi:hypothetical protein
MSGWYFKDVWCLVDANFEVVVAFSAIVNFYYEGLVP